MLIQLWGILAICTYYRKFCWARPCWLFWEEVPHYKYGWEISPISAKPNARAEVRYASQAAQYRKLIFIVCICIPRFYLRNLQQNAAAAYRATARSLSRHYVGNITCSLFSLGTHASQLLQSSHVSHMFYSRQPERPRRPHNTWCRPSGIRILPTMERFFLRCRKLDDLYACIDSSIEVEVRWTTSRNWKALSQWWCVERQFGHQLRRHEDTISDFLWAYAECGEPN